MDNVNNTGIKIGRLYKVPRGFEFPFAGRWLKAVGHHAGCVNFVAAGGNRLSLGNSKSELLAKHADDVRATTPQSFL
jgi:hypothetical protein